MKLGVDGNPVLEQFSEEGFVDCVLRISELKETDTHYLLHLVASYDGEVIGLDAKVVKDIKAGFDSEMNLDKDSVYRKGVTVFRSGPESDRFISVLSFLYTGSKEGRIMVDEESFTAIALHQGPIDMVNQPIKLKIFGKDGEAEDADSYNESYFNIDLKNRLVFWNEKDEEYRKPLLRALTK